MSDVIEKLRGELKVRPLEALRLYELEIAKQTEETKRLEIALEETMERARCGRSISHDTLLHDAPRLYGSPRHADRQVLIAACVEQLVILGAREQRDVLEGIGIAFEALVLEGIQQQQLCGRLAVELGRRPPEDSGPLRALVIGPLIKALRTVLRVGAATTRDSAVEGLGALLKFLNDPEPLFKPVLPDGKKEESDPRVSRLYFARQARRRLMVFAVAGVRPARSEFFRLLRTPIGQVIDRIKTRYGTEGSPELLLDALYARADLLRTLPALVRQSKPKDAARHRRLAVRFLRDAASLHTVGGEVEENVAIALCHFQESVFRTIDVMIKRDATHEDFDKVLADALQAVPRTLVGRARVCNPRVRATFALIRAVSRLITLHPEAAESTRVLTALFKTLDAPSAWPNLGILEGCYFVLPFLLTKKVHNALLEPVLDALFKRLEKQPSPFEELIETHRQLLANSCFRRMLLFLMERVDVHLSPDSEAMKVGRDVTTLLLQPNTEHVFKAFQKKPKWARTVSVPLPQWTAGILIAGTAFERDLLKRSDALFANYEQRPSDERLLLTRILAAELRAASQDAREIARSDLLRRVYARMQTVSLDVSEQIQKTQGVLARLPSALAEAADFDLQDFLEHCGRTDTTARVEELPGYALAMVSSDPSGRIADAIAREVDLTLRYFRRKAGFDCGKLLYQIMMRGPHERIFDYVLPRMERETDRDVVSLFRRHVASVRAEKEMTSQKMLTHVNELLTDLDATDSAILKQLHDVLTLYRTLFVNQPDIWIPLTAEVEGGGLGKLFRDFDALAKGAHVERSKHVLREPLWKTFHDQTVQITTEVVRYRDLPIREFDARAAALARAQRAAADIQSALDKHPGLHPPERDMLISLLRRLGEFFGATIKWFCEDAGHRQKSRPEQRDPATFYDLFAAPKGPSRQTLEGVMKPADEFPAEFPHQRLQFEKFFVAWMTSDLDVDMLKKQFGGGKRWTWSFRIFYALMTSLVWISLIILIPCGVAAWFDYRGTHYAEGLGFLVLQIVVVLAALISLMPWLRNIGSWIGRQLVRKRAWLWEKKAETPPQQRVETPVIDETPSYRAECSLPRLARLIAIQMALLVEFEHSYVFPLHTSTWILLLLMLLSFLTTAFFVDREIVDPSERRKVRKSRASERSRVRQVVAVALTHAFIISVLFATMFASHAHNVPHSKPKDIPREEVSGFLGFLDRIARHVDDIPPKSQEHHHQPFFAGVLPRDVEFDTEKVLDDFGLTIPKGIAHEMKFTYYPTIVLAWTALGLFVGVFLEGFVKGERLRGGDGRDSETHTKSN